MEFSISSSISCDARDQLAAKPQWCSGLPRLVSGKFRFENNADCGVPDMTIDEAAEAGVKTIAL